VPIEKPVREVAVITGASAGIGRACAREFARRGAHIGLLGRGTDGLNAAKREVEDLGARALALSTDVSDINQVERAADRVETELGPIDIWVNNAFAGMFSKFLDMAPEEFRRVTEVTYFGQVHGTRAALKRMIPRDRGTVVLVGSALAYRGIALQSAYCGAKHALQGFLDSIRVELLHDHSNVHITMVQLPGVNTPQFDWVRSRVPGRPRPIGTIYQPEVAAHALWYAAHARRKEIVVGAPAMSAILADKFTSSLFDRYLARNAVESQYEQRLVAGPVPDNLFEPVPGDHGAHGRFSNQARAHAPLLWANMNRGWIAIALGVIGAATLISSIRR
jgi:short-subunit dehydrogenase